MKVKSTAWILFLMLSILLPLSDAAEEAKEKTRLPARVKEADAQRLEKPQPQKIRLPIYKPPQRGAPQGRVGGGTRGGPS
jgi:hypothetical protein